MQKIKMVIDTDGVADDVRAISIALQHPDVEVLAITVICGCVNADQAVANIARTLRVNNCTEIPIYKGASTPIIGNIDVEKRERLFFGVDGLSDLPREHPKVLASDWNAHENNEHAALALIRIFENNPDTTLVCIGPLTNVALAIKIDCRFRKWAKKIVIMGGNIHAMGNVSSQSTAEFNFSYDPEGGL